jgi:hypothetical protein
VVNGQAKRGLRFCAGDCERAVGFIMEQRRLASERKDRQRTERKLRAEQRGYGRTPNGQRVDMQLMERLCLLGYDRPLAAEALRQASTTPEKCSLGMLSVTSRWDCLV